MTELLIAVSVVIYILVGIALIALLTYKDQYDNTDRNNGFMLLSTVFWPAVLVFYLVVVINNAPYRIAEHYRDKK